MNNNTHDMTLAGLLCAVGLVLPFAVSHGFGIPGTVLLPMHIPVFLAGFLCGPLYGALCGAIVPVVSSLITGMPSPFPMAPIMTGELFTYGLVSGLCYRRFKLSAWPSIIVAMVFGRVVYGLIFAALLTANGGPIKALSMVGAIAHGIPGIILQLIVIPVIISAAERSGMIKTAESKAEDESIETAKRLIALENASFVLIRDGHIVHTADGRGVRPIMNLLDTKPELLRGAVVVDKIIGKAAALLLDLGGARRVYGELISVRARDYLQAHSMRPSYGRCIDVISNRTGDGICPLERAVKDVDDPEQARKVLKETIKKLMAKAM